MGPETAPPPKLPCIDLSSDELIPGTPLWDRTVAEVLRASVEFGFFEVVYPAIDVSERRVMFAKLAELFALPLETKWRNTHDRPYHGYIGGPPNNLLYESLGVDLADDMEVDRFTGLMWPQGNPGFRVMEYKPPEPSPDAVINLKSHTDTNFITVLCENSGGLEVLVDDGSGGTFAPLVATMPGSLFVFIGDAFMAWSNGRLRSVPHRVVLREDKPRLSTGLFMLPEGGWMIEAPEDLIGDENPRRLYRPFEYFDILTRCYANPVKNMSGQQVFNELLRL
ncbi:1-aminocyclopropane-1-carboxylate oxidase 1 [Acorus calamus]|uniref:1-aminocyclopropane-1-carboxylate oxidase 1 n=1 Tax=Acorus calamus TaxID=4465 RepID=A0AAV9C1X4_ACOCL|nr:1-aminocyclopropane-1-carboxylate oxidase 1 [Acorus calamus]